MNFMLYPKARRVPAEPAPFVVELLNDYREVRAAIHRASSGGAVIGNRTLFAVADGAEPSHRDATALEVIAHRVGAALSEGQVVFDGADAVAVAFDGHVEARVGLQLGN